MISDAVRIAIGATPTTPTATAAAAASAITGDEPAKNRLFAPTQEPVITEGPRSDSAPVTPVEVSRDQAAASGAIKVPVDNDEEPQLEQAPVVTGEGAEAEQAEDIPAVVEETAMEDAVEVSVAVPRYGRGRARFLSKKFPWWRWYPQYRHGTCHVQECGFCRLSLLLDVVFGMFVCT